MGEQEGVTRLEDRVDQIEVAVERADRRSDEALGDARRASRAHEQNVRLLNAVRATQAEHSQTLEHHERMIENQGRVLEHHGQVLEHHSAILGDHTSRLDSIDGKLGQMALGMHTIEGLLRRLVADD